MIVLNNNRIRAEIDTANGGDVVALYMAGKAEAFNVLDRRGLQCWLKTGPRPDPLSGVLGAFYDPALRTAAWEEKNRSDESATLSAYSGGIGIEKTVSLAGTSLTVTAHVTNRTNAPIGPLQVEHPNLFRGGRMPDRAETALIHQSGKPGPASITFLAPFGQRFGEAHDAQGACLGLAFCREELVVMVAGASNSERLAGFCRANIIMRGVTSDKFALVPGATYTHSQTITMHPVADSELAGELAQARSQRQPGCRTTAETGGASRPAFRRNELDAVFTGKPIFPERWSQICLQYDQVDPDVVRRLIGDFLVPLRYTGVLFELNRGVRTGSHPELAAPWALDLRAVGELIDFARAQGLEVGIEFNTPGHQSETGVTEACPELLEPQPPGSRSTALCMSHPGGRQLVGEVVCELLETLQPDLWHMGGDEVQIQGEPGAFGHCPACSGKAPHKLFGEYIAWLASLGAGKVNRTAMWGDMFICANQFHANVSGNGSEGDVWRALDSLPTQVEIMDWHYYPAPGYGSIDFFLDQGRRVWPATAFNLEGIRRFSAYAAERGVPQAIHTTWAVPNREKLPVESMVWAAVYQWLGTKANQLDIEELALRFCRNFWAGTETK